MKTRDLNFLFWVYGFMGGANLSLGIALLVRDHEINFSLVAGTILVCMGVIKKDGL